MTRTVSKMYHFLSENPESVVSDVSSQRAYLHVQVPRLQKETHNNLAFVNVP